MDILESPMDIELIICLYIRRKIYFKELTHLLMEATKYKTHTLKDAGLENRRRVKVLKSQRVKELKFKSEGIFRQNSL